MVGGLHSSTVMRWDRSHRSSNVEDRRAMGRSPLGGGMALPLLGSILGRFGWRGILLAIAIVAITSYTGVCSGGGAPSPSPSSSPTESRSQPDDELARFVGFVFDDVQDTFRREIASYRDARLVLFRGAVDSACGSASSAVGPFYCPIDHKVYIDLSFYEQLRRRFGASGDFAQAYVIAHEVGHHVQNLRGILGRAESPDSIAVELQADCLAGAWARDADRRTLLEIGDLDEALDAAAAIGDDMIQKKTTGRVQPETWTHGSSKQRVGAFRKGHAGEDCDLPRSAR
jgi:predicted metalloprotease